MKNYLPSVKILGTEVTNASKEEISEYIFKRLKERVDKFYIVTPNPEIMMYGLRHASYQKILNGADIAIPDGIGVLMGGKVLKKKIIGRITGVDLMDEICKQASNRPITVGFLGGRGSVAEKTAECLQKKYPGLRVVFANPEWELAKLKEKHIDILFVAFGFPKQEEWVVKNLPNIPVTAAMGVGGAFDYISGKIPRAPQFVRKAGLEWAFRLVRQPWRIKRQLVLPQFMLEVVREKYLPK